MVATCTCSALRVVVHACPLVVGEGEHSEGRDLLPT